MKTGPRPGIRERILLNVVVDHHLAYSKPREGMRLQFERAGLEVEREGLAPGAPVETVLTLSEHDELGLHRVPRT